MRQKSVGNKSMVTISAEVARLQQVERELQARLDQQAAVAEYGQHALATPDAQAVMDEAVRLVARTLHAPLSKVLELQPGGQELLLKAGIGWQEGLVGQARVSAGVASQAGYTLLSSDPVIVSDLSSETRFSGPQLLLEHQVVSGISVVIPGKIIPFGVLGVHTTEPRIFTSDDAYFLRSVANILASAIERIRTENDLRTSRDQLGIILQGISDGVTVQDSQGNLVYANHAAARIIGYPSAEALLQTPTAEIMHHFKLFDEEGRPLPLDRLPSRQALKGVESPATTLRYSNNVTEEERWSTLTASPVLNQAGKVELVVNIFQDITEFKRIEQSQRLLAEAGNLLAASLDYPTTLVAVAQLAVTHLADWCSVYVLDEKQSINQVAVAHKDPQKLALARELNERYPPDQNASHGVANVLRTGRAEFYPHISDELIEASARDAEHLEAIRRLGLRSAMIIPLIGRGRTLGAISLFWAESGRSYSPNDVSLAEELARRAAIAIDNALLYYHAQEINTELEGRVTKRTTQLQALVSKLKNEISERKRVEEALRRNEAVLRDLFNSAPDATVLVDQNGNIVRVNNQAEKLFGYQREELLGQSIDILLPERFRGRHTHYRSAYFDEPRARPMGAGLDLHARRKDGSEFAVDIMLSPVQTEIGPMVIAAIRDVSVHKRMQAELNEVQRRLIESIEAERLYLAQELHDGPIQELYGVSYHLRGLDELLNAPGGQTEQPGDRRANGPEALQVAEETLAHAIDMLRAICGELRPAALAPFGLEKAIRAHIDRVQEAHPDLNIQLDLTPDGQHLPERVRMAFYRIYQHAVSNVVRHAKADHLVVRFHYDLEQILLEVEDDGCGFELPDRWVELVRRGHLGLVGTAERAESIGGKLKIETAPGKGTCIRVTLPVEQATQDPSYAKGLLDTRVMH